MGGKSDAPDVPSYNDQARLATLQSEQAKELVSGQTRANRPDQVTPYGTTLWEDLGDDRWRQTVSLPEDQQRALDAQMGLGAERGELARGLMSRAGEELEAPLDWDPMATNEVGTGAETRGRVEDAIYGQATSRLDPYWNEERTRVEGQLWNQGLRPGDEAYDTAMGNFTRGRTDAYQTAVNEATRTGGVEAQREFGMDLQRRQQAITEALRRRGVSLGDVNALTSGTNVQAPSMPSFRGAGVSGPADLLGASNTAYRGELDRYNIDQAGDQGMMSGLFGAAVATAPYWGPMLFSDRSLKEDIALVGKTHKGQNVYCYTRDGHVELGVMADESPGNAVVEGPMTGKKLVDYSRID